MAGSYAIEIEQGATFDRTLTIRRNGSLLDLTGYTARMQARDSHDSEDAWLDLTSSPAAGLTLGGTAGTVRILIDADDTADLTERTGVYDLEIESGAGVVTRLLEGSIKVTPEVTRA